jgi:hypothetical protein
MLMKPEKHDQDTLEKAIVLAVFLPIISDMSICSGNQAVAVSIRELTLDSYQFSFAQNAQNILHHLCKPKSCKRLQRLNLVSTF